LQPLLEALWERARQAERREEVAARDEDETDWWTP
jgi:hypothetical protein